ncbi:MAG: hypothetical protein M3Q65_13770 [Chloroflexota bacterium]|nr:hypothetical protein [Chloroflexota bacterium]
MNWAMLALVVIFVLAVAAFFGVLPVPNGAIGLLFLAGIGIAFWLSRYSRSI